VSAVDRFLEGLEGVKRSGDGWTARCPSHEDRHPSLSVGVGADGRVLLKCHAGCTTEAIVDAHPRGLTIADLFERQDNGGRRIVATYDYRDEEGTLLSQAVRYEPKDFSQRRPDGNGDWIWNVEGVRRVPYRLPELIAAVEAGGTVYVAEGEKDADALAKAGVVATTSPMGAGQLAGRVRRAAQGCRRRHRRRPRRRGTKARGHGRVVARRRREERPHR
jgi:hypothetical protein